MNNAKQPFVILMADDDEDDQLLTGDAFAESDVNTSLKFVKNGQELIAYLKGEEDYQSRETYPLPSLIIMDLNMPIKDGRETLIDLKNDSEFKSIPVVVLTTSKEEEDMIKSYSLGAASFLSKPVTFEKMVEMAKILGKYWSDTVRLPININRVESIIKS